MFKCCVAVAYMSYLLFAGYGMVGGLSNAERPSQKLYAANMCALMQQGCP